MRRTFLEWQAYNRGQEDYESGKSQLQPDADWLNGWLDAVDKREGRFRRRLKACAIGLLIVGVVLGGLYVNALVTVLVLLVLGMLSNELS